MNKLDAIAKEKFNGDLKAAWDYVLYEVTPEEREEITKYVSKEQLDIGMTALRRTSYNEIDELAASKFNGDLKAAWDYIFSNCSEEEIKRYTSMADAHQAAMAVLLVDGLKESKQSKRERRMEHRIAGMLKTLQVTRDELRNMRNPYRIPLLKTSLCLGFCIAAITGLLVYDRFLGMDQSTLNTGMGILGIANSCCALVLADKLRDYFRFRSVQKAVKKELKQTDNTIS